jgi:hypothetical protein
MVACAGVGELSEAEDGLFGNPDVGRPGEGTVVLGRPIRFGLGDVKAKKNEWRQKGKPQFSLGVGESQTQGVTPVPLAWPQIFKPKGSSQSQCCQQMYSAMLRVSWPKIF